MDLGMEKRMWMGNEVPFSKGSLVFWVGGTFDHSVRRKMLS